MKPFFTRTTQIGIVVKDLKATMKTYVEKYGIGPWEVFKFSKENVADLQIGGKPADYSMVLAMCNIGNTQWELIEQISDNSDYAKFLKEHGEGIHHIAVGPDSKKEFYEFCESNNLKSIMKGDWLGANGTIFTYDYIDTIDDLKLIAELHAPDENFIGDAPLYTYPDGPMPREPVFTDVLQIGIICRDLDKTCKTYTEKYGLGPWKVYEFNNKTVQDLSVGGVRQDYAMDLALAQFGNVQWELIQPLDEISDYAKFLREQGEGVHHMALETKDYNEAKEFCDKLNIKQVQYGYWGSNFHYDYRDTRDDMKCIVELYGPEPSFEWPEPVRVYSVAD